MRRHTMKHPSGPATTASPMPARSARVKKLSSIRSLRGARIGMERMGVVVEMSMVPRLPLAPVGKVDMVVRVAVDCEASGGAGAEKSPVFRTGRDDLGRARAADMA